MSTYSRSYGNRYDVECKFIHLVRLLLVISSAMAIDYASQRRDGIPLATDIQKSTTALILDQLNRQNGTSEPSLQEATEYMLHYGAFLRIQILDTFGKLIYDRYDHFGTRQIQAFYRVYEETLDRNYNIFDIVPSVLENPDMGATKICESINKHVPTCIKESSRICTGINVKNEEPEEHRGNRLVDSTRRIYRYHQISNNYPNGISIERVFQHLRTGSLHLTGSLFAGLLQNVPYDNFDEKVQTAERKLLAYLEKNPNIFLTRRMENSIVEEKISDFMKNYLSKKKKLFSGSAADWAEHLSNHVLPVNTVNENIEFLGTIYENSSINLKYLFEIVLSNDSMDPDILEARDYLVHELTTKKIVESYLNVEKYRQKSPDQLLLEILGQLKDINYAEDLVTALYSHARFWHKSHMIGNVNDLLELFDAYENLSKLKYYRSLNDISRIIKNNLRDSNHISVELLCSRPRKCLHIGLQMLYNCAIIDEDTKRAIELFVNGTTHDCPYLIMDEVDDFFDTELQTNQTRLFNIENEEKSKIQDEDSIKNYEIREEHNSTNSGSTIIPIMSTAVTNLKTESSFIEPKIEFQSLSTLPIPREETTEKPCLDCNLDECVEGDCESLTFIDDCFGSSCNGYICEGEDCSDEQIIRKIVTIPSYEKIDENRVQCDGLECGTDSTKSGEPCNDPDCLTREKVESKEGFSCKGDDCSDQSISSKITTLNDLDQANSMQITTMVNCQGDECSKNIFEKSCDERGCQIIKIGDSKQSRRCNDPNCSPDDPGSNSIICTGEGCTPAGKICDDKNCTINRHENESTTEPDIERTTVQSESSKRISIPSMKPTTICNNSDPHYQRKLSRLRKSRLIDDTSSKSSSSFESFDKNFEKTEKQFFNSDRSKQSRKSNIATEFENSGGRKSWRKLKEILKNKNDVFISNPKTTYVEIKNSNESPGISRLEHPEETRLPEGYQKSNLEESMRRKNGSEKSQSRLDEEEILKILKYPKKSRFEIEKVDDDSGQTKMSKKRIFRVTDLKASRPTKIWNKQTLETTFLKNSDSHLTSPKEKIILNSNSRENESTSLKTKNPKRTSFEINRNKNLTKIQSQEKTSPNRHSYHDYHRGNLNQRFSHQGALDLPKLVLGSSKIEGSSKSELERENESVVKKEGLGRSYSNTKYGVKKNSIKMDAGQGTMKEVGNIISEEENGGSGVSINGARVKSRIHRIIESDGPKKWHWSTRTRRVGIVPENHQGQTILIKPTRHFSRRRYNLQTDQKDHPMMQQFLKIHQIPDDETNHQTIRVLKPELHETQNWEIQKIQERKGEPVFTEIRKHRWENHGISKNGPKLPEEKIHRIRYRGSKIYDESVKEQPEWYKMENQESTTISQKND